MSDFERGKFFPKKKFQSQRESQNSGGRSFFNSKSGSGYSRHEKENSETTPKIKQPTILLKAREPIEEASVSPKRTHKESESSAPSITIATPASRENDASTAASCKQMTKSIKFMDEGILHTETLQEFVQENSDFLVVGIVGGQGVGKSTILNLLAQNKVNDNVKKSIFKYFHKKQDDDGLHQPKVLIHKEKLDSKESNSTKEFEIFKTESVDDIEDNLNATQGLDIFITPNRTIMIDCQPIVSVSVLEELIQCESKRTSLVSEFIPLENSGEIQGLQLTAFLMSVCHVFIVVQDWFLDSNLLRFIETAEMLKPTLTNPEDEMADYFPNLLIIHNKAQMEDFTPSKYKIMQDIYKSLLNKTKMHLDTNLGLGSGRVLNSLNIDNCGDPINLFLIPEYNPKFASVYNGHPTLEDLIKRLRANILGSTKNPLTHFQLTEKTWLAYCSKVWDSVRKSSFFVEYTKLMP